MSSTPNSIAEAALSLRPALSHDTGILTDPTAEDFKHYMQRWSDISVQTPSAIFTASSEEDILQIVIYAVSHSIPFVAKSGGHSTWSTIDSSGWIIDLTNYCRVDVDVSKRTATIQSGVLTKALNEAVFQAGFCIPSASAASVGHIPFMLGGGQSLITGMYGMSVDSLVSARVITATKGLVVASDTENPDLFWALKGAGQFFGLVTEVTMRIFPIENEIISWTFVFLPSQVKEAAKALDIVVKDGEIVRSPGMVAVMASPGTNKPMIIVNTKHFQSDEEAQKVIAPILDAKPERQIKNVIDFAHITDSLDAFNNPGGLKRQISCGMRSFSTNKFEQSLKQWIDLVDTFPNAFGTFFMFTWVSTEAMKKVPDESTCWSHRDCGIWNMAYIAGTDEVSAKAAGDSAEEFMEMCKQDQDEDEKAIFPNHTRVHSLEQRYRGEERRKRLRELKRIWDPKGIFTTQFL